MKLRLLMAAMAAAALAAIFVGAPGGPAPALAVPANDNLANAQAITTPARSGIVATGNNYGAFLEAGEEQPCGGHMDSTVWYTWTSPGTPGTVVFDTWGSSFDTVLAIYTGSTFPLSQVDCDDDMIYPLSGLALNYAANTTYRIQAGGYDGAAGDIVLNISLGAAIYVDTTSDNNSSDSLVTLREAMLLAVGGTGGDGVATGLGRSLNAGEAALILNPNAMGASGPDLIHFSPGAFPASTGATITMGSTLPPLSAGSDVVSGVGAGVIINGQDTVAICIVLESAGNLLEGLDIRRCDTGIYIVDGSNNRIGGSLIPGQANFISGSDDNGILMGLYGSATGNAVVGNVIGFRRDGSFDIFDTNSVGIRLHWGSVSNTIGGTGPGEGNVVSLSTADGIQLMDNNNVVMGNKIGTDPTGSFGYGNTGHGISVGGAGNIIGGIGPGEGNIIASNYQYGVLVNGIGAIGNTIRGNSIHDNQTGGISGATGGPVISSVSASTVTGTSCGLCTVDIYSDTGDQGRLYVGTTTADSLGFFAATGIAHPLANVTATGTPTSGTYAGSTSYFSAPFTAPTNLDGDGVFDSADACPSVPEDSDAFQDSDGCPDPDNDLDGICDPGQSAAGCTGSDTGQMVWDPAGTLPAPTLDCRNTPEDLDAFKDGDGCPEPDNDNDGQADADDDCDGTDLLAGVDGMLGSPQDLNHNGIKDVSEATLTTDDMVKTFEDYDTVLDGDGCHDSPGEDFDGDGFTDDAEALTIGTDAGYPCGFNSWPADLWDQPPLSANKITVQDLTAFIAPVRRLGTSPGSPNFSERWDLVPGKGIFSATINVQDMTKLVTLAPPMLSGARALNGPGCPMPSQ